ncbi:MAG TPA: sugar transferase [Candidatus Binatia bacterium]|nr:sugar transferase [Candidatus Binatia bacterium]
MHPASPAAHRAVTAAAIGADLVAIASAFFLTALVRFTPERLLTPLARPDGVALFGCSALLWVAFLSAREAYAPRAMISIAAQILRVLGAALPAWVLTHLVAFALKIEVPFESRLAVGLSLPATLLFLAAGRLLLVRPLARRAYGRLAHGPVLVLGDTDRAVRLVEHYHESYDGARAVHLHDLSSMTPERASDLVESLGVSEVVIEPQGRALEEVFDTAFACLDAQAEVVVVSNQLHVVTGRAAIADMAGVPAMRFRRPDLRGPEAPLRRLIDIAGAAVCLVALAPVFLLIAIAVKFSSPGPIFFRQERVGRGGRRFTMLKFRTMVAGNDPSAHRQYLASYIQSGAPASVADDGTRIYKLTQDPRVTAVGAWLRAFSLDELPQFWNVLMGEMSLVGPRPCLPYEWELYRPWQRRRLDVMPGCTGLWQVTARSHVAFDEMVILDLHYAHHGSIGRDLWLIAQTLPAMIRGRGGY